MDPTGEWGIIKIEVFPALNQVDEYHCYKSKAKLPNGCNAHYGLVRTNDWVFHRQLFFHLSRACLGKIIVFHPWYDGSLIKTCRFFYLLR
jgi:hypothetical protein